MALWSLANGVSLSVKLDNLRFLNQGLPPDLNECFLYIEFHGTPVQ
jgi:hypothetical protein